MNSKSLYWYTATLVRVIDGDTIVVDVDLGMSTWKHKVTLRILGIDTPEPRGKTKVAGDAATQRAIELIGPPGSPLVINTRKKDSFGRWIASIQLTDGSFFEDTMLKEGHAVPYKK